MGHRPRNILRLLFVGEDDKTKRKLLGWPTNRHGFESRLDVESQHLFVNRQLPTHRPLWNNGIVLVKRPKAASAQKLLRQNYSLQMLLAQRWQHSGREHVL